MNNLRAALTVTFGDQVSPGLKQLERGLEGIKRVGRELRLTGLDGADRTLRGATAEASALSRALGLVSSAADRATAAIHRAGQAVRQWGANTLGPASRLGAFTAVASGYSVAAPIQHYAGLEDQLRRIAIIKGLRGPGMQAEIRRLEKFLGHEALLTGQTTHAGAETYIDLIKAGTPLKDVEEVLAAHHRAATAFYTKPEEFTKVTAALNNQFKVPHHEMDQALSAVGLAANLGMMSVANFGQEFPRIAGMVTSKGMLGRESANKILAMLQTQMLTSGLPSSAAAEVFDGIQYIFSHAAMSHFEMKQQKGEVADDVHRLMDRATGNKGFKGINLFRFLRNAETAGVNPIEAMLDKLEEMRRVGKLTSTEMETLMGHMFGNQQAANFWRTQLELRGKRREMEARLNGVDQGEAAQMFNARFEGPQKQMDTMGERLEQINRRLGRGFLPIMQLTNGALARFHHVLEAADQRAEGLGDTVLALGGGVVALAGGLALLGAVWPLLAAGLSLFLNPMTVLLGLLAGGAYYVMQGWESFGPAFAQVWEGARRVLIGFGAWIVSTLKLDHAMARKALIEVWEGLTTWFEGASAIWKKIFGDLFAVLDGWTGGALTEAFKAISGAVDAVIGRINALIEALKGLPDWMFSGNGTSRAIPNTPPEYLPPGGVQPGPGGGNILELPFSRMSAPIGNGIGGTTTIYVRAEPGTVVTRIEGDLRGMAINPGPTTVRI